MVKCLFQPLYLSTAVTSNYGRYQNATQAD